jgi:hypothetical protein
MLTRRLAEFVVDTRTSDIPAQILEGARQLLDLMRRFETMPNIRSLIKATVPHAGATPQAARSDVARAAK